ncbi:hypothetical protein [Methylovirgula sp. 4M-Z18]|uniref:hypothetical protein n=1 Tax=Methylovirgula sp. 4M-Z18 TaxID=2293567 RepID=UPI000E2E63CA|nr:hypothetical protein [Methylovirgula sp. 4M-Z18]
MHNSYAIEFISPRTVDGAYPLAKVIVPSLQHFEWQEFCQSHGSSNTPCDADENEQIIVALNARAYVKGLCIYAVKTHLTYRRVLDVPLFVIASAADKVGVGAALIDFLKAKCSQSGCSGIRCWAMNAETWANRLGTENIAHGDSGSSCRL